MIELIYITVRGSYASRVWSLQIKEGVGGGAATFDSSALTALT